MTRSSRALLEYCRVGGLIFNLGRREKVAVTVRALSITKTSLVSNPTPSPQMHRPGDDVRDEAPFRISSLGCELHNTGLCWPN